jgi:hypothetical protein
MHPPPPAPLEERRLRNANPVRPAHHGRHCRFPAPPSSPAYPPVAMPPGEVDQLRSARREETMSYREAFSVAAKEALPLSSTPPPAHSAAMAASCDASSASDPCAVYSPHVAAAAAATSAGVRAPGTSRSLRSTARRERRGAAGVKEREVGPAAAQSSNTTARLRSGRPASSGTVVLPDHCAGPAPGVGGSACTSAVSPSQSGVMRHATGRVQPGQAGDPLALKARSSNTNSSRRLRCA